MYLKVSGEPRTRNQLVMDHMVLVKSLANRVVHRIPAHVELKELISVGVLGLIEAARRYQPSLGVPFDAFARRRVHGAMLDALREVDWAPRSLRRIRREFDSAIATLRHELGREPNEAEIAAALNLSASEYERRLDQLRGVELAAIRRAAAHSGVEELTVAIDSADGPHACLERKELRELLAAAIAELPERERHILALYYQEELTLAEIGEVLGVSESRISQLRTQAIGRLRAALSIICGQNLS
jgi:RNA polymerase sigma factor FliA